MQRMLRYFLDHLLLSIGCLLVPDIAAANVIYTYVGQIERIEYNNTSSNTPSPFTQGESVSAEITIPALTSGHFVIVSSLLFIEGVPVPGVGLGSGYVQFGSPDERIRFSPGDVTVAIVGNFPETPTNPLIEHADLCCIFQPPWFGGGENGQTIFNENEFRSAYLPTGQTNTNVTAFGTGIWSARVIAEPASVSMFALALITLLTVVGGWWHRGRQSSPGT